MLATRADRSSRPLGARRRGWPRRAAPAPGAPRRNAITQLCFGAWACSRRSGTRSWPRSRTTFELGVVTAYQLDRRRHDQLELRRSTTERGRVFVRVNEGKAEVDVAWEARLVARARRRAASSRRRRSSRATAGRTRRCRRRAASGSSVFPWRAGVHLAPREVDAGDRRARSAPRSRSSTSPGSRCPSGVAARQHLRSRSPRRALRRGSRGSDDPRAQRRDRDARRGARAPRDAGARSARARDARDHPRRSVPRQRAVGRRPRSPRSSTSSRPRAAASSTTSRSASTTGAGPARRASTSPPRWSRGYQRGAAADRRPIAPRCRSRSAPPRRGSRSRASRMSIWQGSTNPEKDFRAFLARCEAWRGPALGQLTAAL